MIICLGGIQAQGGDLADRGNLDWVLVANASAQTVGIEGPIGLVNPVIAKSVPDVEHL